MQRPPETHPIRHQDDVVRVRQYVRQWAADLGLSLVDQTKVVTAASELARNTFEYGGGGELHLHITSNHAGFGLTMIFEDNGPGIPDVELALKDGYTSGKGLGLGLGGARRLMDHFHIDSAPGKGTRITITKWKSR